MEHSEVEHFKIFDSIKRLKFSFLRKLRKENGLTNVVSFSILRIKVFIRVMTVK